MTVKHGFLMGLAAFAFLFAGAAVPAGAESPDGMRLYVFSSGRLTLAKSVLQDGAQGKVTIPVGFFLIKHPKGNVLFDTGNNDKIIDNPDYWGPFIQGLGPERSPDVAIDAQLAKIDIQPEDVDFVVLGHFHADHAGNMGKFQNATFVYQRDEAMNAFWPQPGYATFYITEDFSFLRNDLAKPMPSKFKTIELDGDLDLFGDGSVMVHRAVSHTPGSQILVVRLPKSGTVVLPSDAAYFKENLEGDRLPGIGSVYSPSGMLQAYAWMKHLRDSEGADIIYAHDPDVFKAHKQAPEYYE